MLKLAYTLSSGITLPEAAVVVRSTEIHSHTVQKEGEDAPTESKTLFCRYAIYASEAALESGKTEVQFKEGIYAYDADKSLEDQAYEGIKKDLAQP